MYCLRGGAPGIMMSAKLRRKVTIGVLILLFLLAVLGSVGVLK